jgi:hypothetical protein
VEQNNSLLPQGNQQGLGGKGHGLDGTEMLVKN